MKSVITDYEGKVVEWEGSDVEALAKGLNVNCYDCSRCYGCYGCSRCSDCSGCYGCFGCSYCSDCSDCSRCSGCYGCYGCSRCSGCYGCSRCSYCSDCSRCSYCKEQPLNVLTTDSWLICIRQDRTIRIGCQDHTADEWMAFTDEQISAMHSEALVFWKKWKPVIAAILS